MKILVIWNGDADGFVNDLYKEYKSKKEIELTENDIIVINNEADFTALLDSFNKSTNSIPDHIFILVELGWNRKIFWGYEIAFEIMKITPPNDKGIDLQFISNSSREVLYSETTGSAIYHYMVKAFEHYEYPNSTNFDFNVCSKNIWNYYRKHVLSKSLILANIKHKLESVSIQAVIQELGSLSDILDKKTLAFIDNFNKNKKNEKDKEELKSLLENRANELNNALNTSIETKKRAYNVLIIEDDEDWLRRLESIFKSRYESVRCYSNGKEAMQELIDRSYRYDILIADLDLLDKESGYQFNQKIMGFHIVEYAERYCKHLSIRIITSLSSIGIELLFPKKNLKILPKRNFTFINTDYFDDLEKDVILAINRNRNKKGPGNNLWGEKNRQGGKGGNLLYYYYNELTENDRKMIWEFAFENITTLRNVEGGISPDREDNFIKEQKEDIIAGLKIILTNRLYWVWKGYEKEGVFKNDDPFMDRLENKNHTSQMGFKVLRPNSKVDHNYYTIIYGFLFPEEILWLKNKGIILKFEQSYFEETMNDIFEELKIKKPNCNAVAYISSLDQILNKFQTFSKRDNLLLKGNLKLFKDNAPDEFNNLNSSIIKKINYLLSQ